MKLFIRQAGLRDSEFIHNLRTRSEDKKSYFSGTAISLRDHEDFWEKNYQSYWIAIKKAQRVGFYGIVKGDFRFAVIPTMRGKGIGSEMIAHAIKMSGIESVKVAKTNTASLKCFLANGFFIKTNESLLDDCDYILLKRFEKAN